MARQENRLSARTVAALNRPGRHADGGGLYLKIDGARRRWVFRFTRHGKVHEMGLGAATSVSLADARKARNKWRAVLTGGGDPLAAREAELRAQDGGRTFGESALALFAAKSSEWRSAKHRRYWRMTLEIYCAPIWATPVNEVDTAAVLNVLQSLWQTRPETASRLRGRIEAVLDAARAKGHIPPNEANPARWRGHLDKLLPRRRKLSRGHFAAMPYAEVPAFMEALRKREAIAAPAKDTPQRRHGRKARRNDRNLCRRTSLGPADMVPHQKAGHMTESRQPVQDAQQISCQKGPSTYAQQISCQKGPSTYDVTVHGFRSSFRDWAGNETHFPRELAEAALAHVTGDATEMAYRRRSKSAALLWKHGQAIASRRTRIT